VANEPQRVVLFDVDGTLVRTEGASRHSRAFRAAFKSVYGTECRFVPGLHGMTDMQIFMTLAKSMGLGGERVRELAREACRHMVAIYQTPEEGDGHYIDLPGARATVETLAARGAMLGLVTGNTLEIALHKLASVGLEGFFAFGAYGTEAWDRSGLPPIAVARAERLIGKPIDPRTVFVVGDTPRDVACALDNGYRSVAVATGSFGIPELLAAGAELVLPDLQDSGPLLQIVEEAGLAL